MVTWGGNTNFIRGVHMNTALFRILVAAVVASLVAALGLAAPAGAAEANWNYLASTGATEIKAADATISSDLTAKAVVTGPAVGRVEDNSTAAVKAAGLLRVGAVESRAESFPTDTGFATRTTTRLANVHLLGGLIKADVVETTVTNYANDDGSSRSTGNTEFAGLHIVGVNLPAEIPKNYFVSIPGVAAVALNYHASTVQDGNRVTIGSGISVNLLKTQEDFPPAARITVNPSFSFLVNDPPPQSGARLDGFGYGSRVRADVGDSVQVKSGPTAWLRTPASGSDGKERVNNTAAVNVPGVLNARAIASRSTSDRDDAGDATITNTNEIAGINVLGGAVTADAMEATAHGEVADGEYTGSLDLTFVNLEVAGQPIDVDVAPNTSIDVAGLGEVTINKQTTTGRINLVQGIFIKLDTATAGLPVGAEIEVAVAATAIQ